MSEFKKGNIIAVHEGKNHKILAEVAGSLLISKESNFLEVKGWLSPKELKTLGYKVVMQEE